MSAGRKSRAVLAALTVLGAATTAEAEDETPEASRVHAPLPGSDGVYGRFDGSLGLALAAGAELEAGVPGASLRVAGHYLWTAGGYLRYSDALGDADGRSQRALSLGVDVRPLFLPRFALDAEQGPALLDLTLDSLALTGGAYVASPHQGDLGDERGFEAGLGLGLPLFAQASGLWLETRAERRFADDGAGAWLFSLSLAWHTVTLPTEPPR